MKQGWHFYYEEMEQHQNTIALLFQANERLKQVQTATQTEESGSTLPAHILALIQESLKDSECVICLDPVLVPTDFFLTRCGHHFHVACLTQWVLSQGERTKICPHCKTRLTRRECSLMKV